MINGLKHNRDTAPIGTQMCSNKPVDMKQFVQKFNELQAFSNLGAALSSYSAQPGTKIDATFAKLLK